MPSSTRRVQPACTDQLQLYERALGELTASGEQIFGLSCDSSYAQSASREKPAWHPAAVGLRAQGAACGAFGVLHEGGFPERALVVIGPDGVVQWSYQAPTPAELPGVELLREGLAQAARAAAA